MSTEISQYFIVHKNVYIGSGEINKHISYKLKKSIHNLQVEK